MAIALGTECQAFYNSGTQDTPVWVECTVIINVAYKIAFDKLAASCRGSAGVKQYMHGDAEHDLTVSLCHDNADSVWEAFRTAMWAKTPMHMQIYDGDKTVSGNEGYEATYGIFGADETQNLGAVVEDSITLAPSANGMTASDSSIVPLRLQVA